MPPIFREAKKYWKLNVEKHESVRMIYRFGHVCMQTSVFDETRQPTSVEKKNNKNINTAGSINLGTAISWGFWSRWRGMAWEWQSSIAPLQNTHQVGPVLFTVERPGFAPAVLTHIARAPRCFLIARFKTAIVYNRIVCLVIYYLARPTSHPSRTYRIPRFNTPSHDVISLIIACEQIYIMWKKNAWQASELRNKLTFINLRTHVNRLYVFAQYIWCQ